MNTLDKLINDFIFDATEKREFSSKKEDNEFLINFLKSEGFNVTLHEDADYFYCLIENKDLSITADSRANLRPRTLEEAVCVCALKAFIPMDADLHWNKILKALDLEHLIK